MKFPRLSRLIVVCFALFGMLCMQMAMASYICPGTVAGSGNTAVAASNDDQMTGCDGMDTSQPGLCHVQAHGDSAKQSIDNPPTFDIPPFIAAGSVLTLQPAKIVFVARATLQASPLITRTTAPPIAIRNCCFRI